MTDKTLRIILGIIAVNLTIQTVKDVGLFPTAYAQDVQRVEICGYSSYGAIDTFGCAEVRAGDDLFPNGELASQRLMVEILDN